MTQTVQAISLPSERFPSERQALRCYQASHRSARLPTASAVDGPQLVEVLALVCIRAVGLAYDSGIT
jgi:hypothetical protein